MTHHFTHVLLTTRQSLADVQADQLSTLDEMTTAMTGSGYNANALETDAGIGANVIYPAVDNSPMDARLFGDARQTVEVMIAKLSARGPSCTTADQIGKSALRALSRIRGSGSSQKVGRVRSTYISFGHGARAFVAAAPTS